MFPVSHSLSVSCSLALPHMHTQQTTALIFALDNGPLIVHSRVSKYRMIIRCIIFYNSNFWGIKRLDCTIRLTVSTGAD